MSQNYYNLYLDSVSALAETIVIKSSSFADIINNNLRINKQAVSSDKTTWKYYLNLSGEYHPTDLFARVDNDGLPILIDELDPITNLPVIDPSTISPLNPNGNAFKVQAYEIPITSLDTLETIAFNKANMAVHRATAKAYAHNSRNFIELVAKYPEHRSLIIGILYPADLNEAISAPDGKILSWPPEYIESNEFSLVSKLQEWIDGFIFRWRNEQFEITDNMYAITFFGVLYSKLVPEILNIRLGACKTEEVHSFHIRQYLASHNGLDKYLDLLTRKQALFLYRNIRFIERNYGKQDTFEWLVQNIMTERTLPLAEYSMKHENVNDVTFKKKSININVNMIERVKYSLSEVIVKETDIAPDNYLYRKDMESNVVDTRHSVTRTSDNLFTKTSKRFEHSLSSVVATKILESSVIDYTDATPYTLESALINHWLYLSDKGIYNAFIGVKNPRTGDRIPVSVKEAYIYLCYAAIRSVCDEYLDAGTEHSQAIATLGLGLINIPVLPVYRVQQTPLRTPTQIYKVVDKKYISMQEATAVANLHSEPPTLQSTEAFYNWIKSVYTIEQTEIGIVSNCEHHYKRALMQNMVDQMYSSELVDTGWTGETYDSWLTSRNLPNEDFSKLEWMQIFTEVFMQATGSDINTTPSVRNIQNAMVEIMKQLSSYSIQFVKEINDGNVKVLNTAATRVGDYNGKGWQEIYLLDQGVRVLEFNAQGHDKVFIDLFDGFNKEMSASGSHSVSLYSGMGPVNGETFASLSHMRVELWEFTEGITSTGDELYPPGAILHPGWSTWLSMSLEDRQNAKDIYCNCFPNSAGNKINILSLMTLLYTDQYQYIVMDFDETDYFQYGAALVSTTEFINTQESVIIDGIITTDEHQELNGIYYSGLSWNISVFNANHGFPQLPGMVLSGGVNDDIPNFTTTGGEAAIDGIDNSSGDTDRSAFNQSSGSTMIE